ncbi:MAG: sulfite oxidase-like oxidoreductase [Deltaproteobacteria bacterium]|nr:sulfite oxidase-like oxidoreductase [Deltaproteobacteria bacterium]
MMRLPAMKEPGIIKSPDTLRKNRIPPGQHTVGSLPVLHHGETPQTNSSMWAFTIKGLVEEEKTLDFDEFMGFAAARVFSDIHCVTGWSVLGNLWEGVPASLIKDLVRIRPDAGYVIVRSWGGFTTNLPMEEFFDSDVLFAVKHNGKILGPEHGFPVRLVVPRLYFWKSAKWVEGVEFLREDTPGFWESRGYHNHGDPWKEERYGSTENFL